MSIDFRSLGFKEKDAGYRRTAVYGCSDRLLGRRKAVMREAILVVNRERQES